jgi:hypothetical protein
VTPAPATARVPRWRVAAAVAVLAVLAWFGISLAPYYFRNLQFQQSVENITHRVENREKSDDLLRTWVVEKAAALDLPVKAADVHVNRSPDGLRIDVHYIVRINLPVYTVDLHFHPGAGTR